MFCSDVGGSLPARTQRSLRLAACCYGAPGAVFLSASCVGVVLLNCDGGCEREHVVFHPLPHLHLVTPN